MTEPCKYEAEIAVISTNINDIKLGQEKQDKKFAKMFKILDGNGSVGLVTQTALNKASLVRAWWFIGAVALCMVGATIRAFFL